MFSREVIRLRRKSGALFVALYLKQCASSLQKAYGGTKSPPDLLPFPVSLTRSGYPRIIPRFHRRMIYRRDDKADILVKIYLSFFHNIRGRENYPFSKEGVKKDFWVYHNASMRYRPGCNLCVEGEGSNPNPLPSESPFYPVHTPGTGYDLGTHLEGPSHSFVGGISQGPWFHYLGGQIGPHLVGLWAFCVSVPYELDAQPRSTVVSRVPVVWVYTLCLWSVQ